MTGRVHRADVLASAGALIFAIVVHGHTLLAYDTVAFWWDEAHTIWMIEGGYSATLHRCASEVYPPLYFWFICLVTSAASDPDWCVRFVSFAFASACVIPIYAAGRLVGNFRVAAIASMLTATSPIINFYSVEGRVYSMLVFLVATMIYFFFRYASRGRVVDLAGFGISLVLAIHSHHYIVFLLPAPILASWLQVNKTVHFRRNVTLAVIVSFLIYLPWFAIAVRAKEGTQWIQMLWQGWSPLLAVANSIEVFGVGGTYPDHLWAISEVNSLPLFAGFFVSVTIIGVALAPVSRVPHRDGTNVKALQLFAWLLVPLYAAWSYSVLVKPIYVVGRYDLIAYAAFPLLIAIGLDRLQYLGFTKVSQFLCVSLVLGGVATSIAMANQARQPSWRGHDRDCARYIADHADDGDLLLCVGLRRIVTEHYLTQFSSANIAVLSFPEEMNDHPCLYWAGNYEGEKAVVTARQADKLMREIVPKLAEGSTLYVADWTEDDVSDVLFERLKEWTYKRPVVDGDQVLGLYRMEMKGYMRDQIKLRLKSQVLNLSK